MLRVYKTGLAAAEGDIYKPIYLVSLTREVRSDGFDLYAIPALAARARRGRRSTRAALGRGPGPSILARHERDGERRRTSSPPSP